MSQVAELFSTLCFFMALRSPCVWNILNWNVGMYFTDCAHILMKSLGSAHLTARFFIEKFYHLGKEFLFIDMGTKFPNLEIH